LLADKLLFTENPGYFHELLMDVVLCAKKNAC